MDLKRLFALRPQGEGAAGLRAALTATETAKREAQARIAELTADRARLLLDGTASQVAKAETDLAAAREDAERCEAIRAGLTDRLARAEASEAVATVRTAIREAEEATAAFVSFARGKYPGLVRQIVAGLATETAARDARQRASDLLDRLPAELMAGLAVPPDPLNVLWPSSGEIVAGFAGAAQLPREDDAAGTNPYWSGAHR